MPHLGNCLSIIKQACKIYEIITKQKPIIYFADYILQVLIFDKYLCLYSTFLSMASKFSHFPSSGQIRNEGLCEERESAHAQFRPEHISIGLIQWYFLTQSIFSLKNPHKWTKCLQQFFVHYGNVSGAWRMSCWVIF